MIVPGQRLRVPGRIFVLVTRIGFRPAEFSLEVPATGGLEVDVELEPSPVAVQAIRRCVRLFSIIGNAPALFVFRRHWRPHAIARRVGWRPRVC